MSNNLNPNPNPQRKTSIVDLLSTPPEIDSNVLDDSSSSLSRKPSVASSVISTGIDSSVVNNSAISSIRDWHDVPLIDLVEKSKLIFLNGNVPIEEAYKTLATHNLTSLPVEEYENDINCTTFDYGDLNTFLLLVLHKINFNLDDLNLDPHFQLAKTPMEYLNDIRQGKQAPVKFVCQLTSKNPFIKLNENLDNLSSVVEILGSGVHRIAIVNNENHITGILSQRRLIKYLWENARRFSSLDSILQTPLDELENSSTTNVIFVYGDQPLIDALVLMYEDQISSVAVVDRKQNLLGNISITDVQHVSSGSQSFLLNKSCLHFVSVILNSRGLKDGQDSFPIFHVFPNTTVGRVIAKLVATKAHRLWIVSQHPSTSFSSTNKTNLGNPSSATSAESDSANSSTVSSASILNLKPEPIGISGKLIGVVSLTDILGLLATRSTNKPIDTHAARRQRRRSSSSASSRSAKSLEQFRRKSSDVR